MNFFVSGHNWLAKVVLEKDIKKSDRYTEATTRAIESLLDQEEKEGVDLKVLDYDDYGLGLITLTYDEKDSKNYTLRTMEVWQRLGLSPEEMRQTLWVNHHFHRLTQGTQKWEMVGLSDLDAFDRQFNSYWEEVQSRMQPQQTPGKEKQFQI
jgi:hypothetical protein